MAAGALVPWGEVGARAHPTRCTCSVGIRYGPESVRWCGRFWETMIPYMGSMTPDPGPKILMHGIDDIIGNGPNCLLAVSMALAPSALGGGQNFGQMRSAEGRAVDQYPEDS